MSCTCDIIQDMRVNTGFKKISGSRITCYR